MAEGERPRDKMKLDSDMTFVSSGGMSEKRIRRFLEKIHAEYTPTAEYEFDLEQYPRRLAMLASGFAIELPDGEWSGAVLGYVNDRETRRGYISYIGRCKDCERHAAFRLHEAFKELAQERGMSVLRLEVLKVNAHARQFYARLGYLPIEDRGERLLMELKIEANRDSENGIIIGT